MQTRIQTPPSPKAPAIAETSNEVPGTPAKAPAEAPAEAPAARPQNEMRQLNALYSLLEDRFVTAYPIPAEMRHPKSSPTHYDDVLQEMDEAPTRSWIEALTKKIRGSLRLT